MYQRNGTWYAKWYERGRVKRQSLGTKSAQRARVKLVEIESALEAGKPVGYRKDCPIDEFTKTLLPKHVTATKRPYTAKTLLHEWKHFTAWAKPLRLSDVTTETIARYKAHLLEVKGFEKSTVRSSLLALSSIFAAAIKDMHVLEGVNPVKDVGLPKPDTRFPRYLEQAEIDRLLAAAKEHSRDMYMLVALGIFTGMRKNELINARWGWIDFKGGGRVLVQSSGRFRTKSGRDRKIPLNTRLRGILEDSKSDNPDEFIVYPDMPEKDGSETKYRCDFTEAFRTVVNDAGLANVTPHTMRHSFASQLAIAGVSLYKISTWLGHASIVTTQIYAHLSPDDEDINRL
jgi:integrase